MIQIPEICTARPPYSVIINILDEQNYELYCHDERAQEVVHKRNLSEEEVTKAALANIRRGNQELKDLAEAMKHHRGGADYV